MAWPWTRRQRDHAEKLLEKATADHAHADTLRIRAAEIKAAMEDRRKQNHFADAMTRIYLGREPA